MKDARAGIKASEKERDVSVVLDIEGAFALNRTDSGGRSARPPRIQKGPEALKASPEISQQNATAGA